MINVYQGNEVSTRPIQNINFIIPGSVETARIWVDKYYIGIKLYAPVLVNIKSLV